MTKKLLIEALSTNSGGAISHLKNLLENADKQNYFNKIDVYLPRSTKKLMPNRKQISYITPNFFTKTLFLRIIWQTFILNIITIKKKYDCIFVTGSSHLLLTKPVVTISQNLLPFSKEEIKKYFFSSFYLKLIILRFIQKLSFRMSEGIIFLHKYSKKKILSQIGNINGLISIVPHGIEINKRPNSVKKENKFRLIYVSNIDLYKNQVFLVNAINDFLIKNPYYKDKIKVEFYGSSYKPALKNFQKKINLLKENRFIFKYMGLKSRDFIYSNKKNYNTIFLFSSSCENFSVTLIEGMTKGLPILCVNLEPMRSVLGNNAIFYKHNSVKSFQKGLFHILSSFKKRKILSKSVYNKSKQYNGAIVAKKTFSFLRKVSEKNYER